MALPMRLSRERSGDWMERSRPDFGDVLGRFLGSGLLGGMESGMLPLANYGVDIREDGDHIYVDADLPGFRKEDVDVTLENGNLTIRAERRDESPWSEQQSQQKQGGKSQAAQQGQQRQDYLLHERQYQRFVRSFSLPPNVDEQKVQAKLDNGVLKIVLNKTEESKPKKIQLS